MDHLHALQLESDLFVTTVATLDPATPVPSCPDWTAADLLWHLTEVQAFWAAVVRDRLDAPDAAQAAAPVRPDSTEAQLLLFGQTGTALLEALAAADPAETVWTWSDDHTVGFIRRRQTHEALIHRIDAELAAGIRSPVDPALAADGVREFLQIMFAAPSWSDVTPTGPDGLLVATDTGDRWGVRAGGFSGLSPNTGTTYSGAPCLALVDPPDSPAYTVTGKAADVDAWLWQRESEQPLTEFGDQAALARLRAILAEGVQ